MSEVELNPNEGKNLIIEVDGVRYERIPIKTPLLKEGDDYPEIIKELTKDILRPEDGLFISEKSVSVCQGRTVPLDSIKPSWWAKKLSKFVTKTPAGIGLGIPETMEMAIQEIGLLRILFAAAMGAITKLFGVRGVFYRITGELVAAIDGPTANTIPPYNSYVSLAPAKPNEYAKLVSETLGGNEVSIVDINDLGGKILGISHTSIDKEHMARCLKDNPLGQGTQQTPVGIIRKI